MKTYVFIILFQFRYDSGASVPDEPEKRICEERFVMLKARSPASAVKKARRHAAAQKSRYKNWYGEWIVFEAVGIRDAMLLDESDDHVWYNIRRLNVGSRRIAKLVRDDEWLADRISTSL